LPRHFPDAFGDGISGHLVNCWIGLALYEHCLGEAHHLVNNFGFFVNNAFEKQTRGTRWAGAAVAQRCAMPAIPVASKMSCGHWL
jgi:hypothetical protein